MDKVMVSACWQASMYTRIDISLSLPSRWLIICSTSWNLKMCFWIRGGPCYYLLIFAHTFHETNIFSTKRGFGTVPGRNLLSEPATDKCFTNSTKWNIGLSSPKRLIADSWNQTVCKCRPIITSWLAKHPKTSLHQSFYGFRVVRGWGITQLAFVTVF